MAIDPIYGDLNDANNKARYDEDREILKAGDDAAKGVGELSGKATDNFFKAFAMARKNPLMAIFGMFSTSGAELQAYGKAFEAVDAADQVRRQQAQARAQGQGQGQNAPPPPSPPPPP